MPLQDKLAVLQATRTLWTWLAENPTKDKNDYYRMHKPRPQHYDCHCCDWVLRQRDLDETGMICSDLNECSDDEHFETWISHCPLKDLWPQGCCFKDSPFNVWLQAEQGSYDPETRSFTFGQAELIRRTNAALAIVEGCNSAIRKLLLNPSVGPTA